MTDAFLEMLLGVDSHSEVHEWSKENKIREEKRLAELNCRRNNPDRLEILKRAKALVWCDDGDREHEEPTIDIDGIYSLGDASLTVNPYGATCLKSPNMFIADIDGNLDDGALLGKYSWLSPLHCAFAGLDVLDELAGTDFKAQSYRVYTTYAGYRIICTSQPIDVTTRSVALLRFLWSDPRYALMCDEDKNYRARLTPKPWRVLGEESDLNVSALRSVYDAIDEWHVCWHIGWYRNGVSGDDGADEELVHPDLVEQLRVHDDFCLQVKDGAKLA